MGRITPPEFIKNWNDHDMKSTLKGLFIWAQYIAALLSISRVVMQFNNEKHPYDTTH